MKIALLGDTHFGVRGDSEAFRKNQFKFFEEIFFPYLLENKIDTVIQLGDLMDRRKFVNYVTLQQMRQRFFSFFKDNNIELHVLLGNHDVYYRNTNEVNSLNELFHDTLDNVFVYQNTSIQRFGSKKFFFLPWITRDNMEESFEEIERTDADICIGHLELNGFPVYKGIFAPAKMEVEPFKDFHRVFTGHYHTQSNHGNIYYLGTPYEMTWADYDDPKGFHVYDTETDELEFVKNQHIMYRKIYYDDSEGKDYDNFDLTDYEGCILKMFVSEKTDADMYERFVQRLSEISFTDMSISDLIVAYNDEEIEDIQVENTLSILNKSIDSMQIDDDSKNDLKQITSEIFSEALAEGQENK